MLYRGYRLPTIDMVFMGAHNTGVTSAYRRYADQLSLIFDVHNVGFDISLEISSHRLTRYIEEKI